MIWVSRVKSAYEISYDPPTPTISSDNISLRHTSLRYSSAWVNQHHYWNLAYDPGINYRLNISMGYSQNPGSKASFNSDVKVKHEVEEKIDTFWIPL